MRNVVRAVAVALMSAILLTGVTTTAAHAAPDAAPSQSASAGALAWECPAGDVCVYTQPYGGGSRCNWANADSNWHSGSIRCGWAATTPVRSIYNRGQSSSFLGVILNTGINNQGLWDCVGQGAWRGDVHVYLGSHYWTNGFPYCY